MYAICNGFTGETEHMFNGKLAQIFKNVKVE